MSKTSITHLLGRKNFCHPELYKANQNFCHSELVSESSKILSEAVCRAVSGSLSIFPSLVREGFRVGGLI
ncbi:hypothetical protein IJ579_06050 [bacterium]|nr:hypothetical protein [bacterium]